MQAPEASIILPAFRDGPLVAEALVDVRAQVGVNWECVLVLDGADAPTREAAARAIDGDPRVRILDLPHGGLVSALNAGVAAARAPILVRFDADDRMTPDRVASQVAFLNAHRNVAVVSSHVTYAALDATTDGRGMQRHVAWLNTLCTHDDLAAMRFVDAPVAHPAVAMRRERVLADLGGAADAGLYRDGDFAEDHDLWLRLFAARARFGVVPRPLVTWRDRPGRLTRADLRYRDDRRKRLVHAHLVDGPLASGRPIRVWGAGDFGRRHVRGLREAATARGRPLDLRGFLDIDPAKVGRILQGNLRVFNSATLGPPDGGLTLVAVAAAGARPIIEAALAARGHLRERDYLLLQ